MLQLPLKVERLACTTSPALDARLELDHSTRACSYIPTKVHPNFAVYDVNSARPYVIAKPVHSDIIGTVLYLGTHVSFKTSPTSF